jgi:hypothetical protein
MGLFDIVTGVVDLVEDTVSDTVDYTLGSVLEQDDIDTIKKLGKAGIDIYGIATMTGAGVDVIQDILDD